MIMTEQNKIGDGLECSVYNVGNGRCYKGYKDEHELDKIYRAAKKAAAAGLGPDVYEKDDYGYYTEIVETFNNRRDFSSDEYDDLLQDLQELFGSNIFDLHSGNVGRKDGRLVCIDFGIGISIS